MAAQRQNPQDVRLAETLGRIKYKIFVMSGKGGVGKSSVAVNLAAALAALGLQVGILDVDLHGPSVPRLLGLLNEKDAPIAQVSGGGDEVLIEPVQLESGLKVLSMDALLADRDRAVVWRGPKKVAAIRQFISDTAWGELDFLIIDSPPGTSDEHLTILRMIPDALCLVVTTPQEIALADVRKAVNFLRLLKSPVLGLVENMGAFPCPHCGGKIDLFRPDGGLELARKLELPFLASIPLDPAAARAADQGLPAVMMPENGPAKSAFFALATSVKAICATKSLK
jgi:Mrp family chromosome partitioning ATPase